MELTNGLVNTLLANTTCGSFALIYIAGFYLFRDASANLSRDHPKTIASRIKSVILASIVIPIIVWSELYMSGTFGNMSIKNQISSMSIRLGLYDPTNSWHIIHIISPLLLTMILFLGPLTLLWFEEELPFQQNFNFQKDAVEHLRSLEGQRNYIAAPFTEEFVFRACEIALLYQAGHSKKYLIFISPIWFGTAHLHHVWEKYRQYGSNKKALKRALLSSSFQFAYTTVFGWYASFVFVRTGSVWPPFLCHSFCNMMGFPNVEGISYQKKWEQIVIWANYIVGVILFYNLIYYLTPSASQSGSIYW
ncbi:hypothetical protein J3Q64DRAFT_1099305 [Phycomyces blakesleeanus]|uniref:intramembrane prenyl-peptidase Rce1 n=1 Tax=Phycomyces blakesleeanus TaxID=4837 RepID=A0ABR3B127_PHYBL